GLNEIAPPPDVCYKCESTISYGIVLANRSESEDARDVEIDIDFVGATGKVEASDSHYLLGGIPAGTKFYLGGQVFVGYDLPAVTHLDVALSVHKRAPRSLVAPLITSIRLSTNPSDGTVVVDGDVTNQATKDLSSLAEINAVYFDSAGAVVGGAKT